MYLAHMFRPMSGSSVLEPRGSKSVRFTCFQAGTLCCLKLRPSSVTSLVLFDFQALRSSFGICLQLTKPEGYLWAQEICLGTLEMRTLSHIIHDKEILASEACCQGEKTPLFSQQNLQEKEDTTDFCLLASSHSRLLQHYFPLTPITHFFCQEQI